MSLRSGYNPSGLVTTNPTVEGELRMDHRSERKGESKHRGAKTGENIHVTDKTVPGADPASHNTEACHFRSLESMPEMLDHAVAHEELF